MIGVRLTATHCYSVAAACFIKLIAAFPVEGSMAALSRAGSFSIRIIMTRFFKRPIAALPIDKSDADSTARHRDPQALVP